MQPTKRVFTNYITSVAKYRFTCICYSLLRLFCSLFVPGLLTVGMPPKPVSEMNEAQFAGLTARFAEVAPDLPKGGDLGAWFCKCDDVLNTLGMSQMEGVQRWRLYVTQLSKHENQLPMDFVDKIEGQTERLAQIEKWFKANKAALEPWRPKENCDNRMVVVCYLWCAQSRQVGDGTRDLRTKESVGSWARETLRTM